MRVLYFLFLVAFVGAVGLFAYQNNFAQTVRFWDRSWELTFPLVVGATYLLGMLSGWTVLGMLKRVRTDANQLWTKVQDYNELHPIPEDKRMEVSFYFGQCVIPADEE